MSGLDVTPRVPAGRQVIQRYGNGGFRIAGTVHTGSVLVFAERTVAWAATAADQITLETLAPVLDGPEEVGILLIGCGRTAVPPPAGLAAALRPHGIVLEWMDTGAACRTFDVLLTEERPVAAALIAVD